VDVTEWLCSPAAEGPLAAASAALSAHPEDPLAAASAVRGREWGLTTERAIATAEQAALRRLAAQRYGIAAGRLLLTRDGLEQATQPRVANARAALVAGGGASTVLDLTAGLGFDASAFGSAGLQVIAVERDPATAAFCSHNNPGADVIVGDATDPTLVRALLARLGPMDVVFVDPARRSVAAPRELGSARARPERDPERWSPPWSFVAGLPHPRIAVKTAPSFEPPANWYARWTSVDRTVVECSTFSWPVLAAKREAAVLNGDITHALGAGAAPLPTAAAIGGWLLEPDPAITRAGAESALRTRQPDLQVIGPGSSWLTCVAAPSPDLTGLVRAYRVVMELSGSPRRRRDELRRRGIETLTVKTKDVREDPMQVLRQLDCREGTGMTLILTRWRGRTISVLADPVPAPRG
jgi:hypothetical protein